MLQLYLLNASAWLKYPVCKQETIFVSQAPRGRNNVKYLGFTKNTTKTKLKSDIKNKRRFNKEQKFTRKAFITDNPDNAYETFYGTN